LADIRTNPPALADSRSDIERVRSMLPGCTAGGPALDP
jgi:hypothetical protein